MSSPCLSGGGGRTYGFELEIVKSPSTSTRTSHTSSPSSTISESSNSPLAISTRKPRTPRKRPNQTYNEAAALLSTAYPNIFSSRFTNPRKFTKPHQDNLLLDESSPELLWPFRVFDGHSGFLLHHHQPIIESEKPSFNGAKVFNSVSCSDKVDSQGNSVEFGNGYEEDFDAESILDEEIEEGIDSIMGNLSVSKEKGYEGCYRDADYWYGNGNPMGKFQIPGNGIRAFRSREAEGNWWGFPIVDMLQISPRLSSSSSSSKNWDSNLNLNQKPKPKKKGSSGEKKKKKVEKPVAELEKDGNSIPESNSSLLLKLNYDDVLNAWSDRGSPFSDEIAGAEGGTDVSARLAQIDLFGESGGVREASVLRYKEKRRTRLFSKKIRYQVRKVNADQRPRMKGRFVRRPQIQVKEEKKNKVSSLSKLSF